MGIIQNIVSNFTSRSWATGRSSNKSLDMGSPASVSTTKSNPIYKSIESLNGSFRLKTVDGYEYVSFGEEDDIPDVLDKLSMQSPTHRGIILKKSKMVAGNGFDIDSYEASRGMKNRFSAFFKHAGGQDITLNEVFSKMAFSYEQYGAVPLLLKVNDQGRVIKVQVLEARSVRAGTPTQSMEIPYWVVRRSFKNVHYKIQEKAVRYETYKKGKKSGTYVMYIKNPYSTNPIYGTPNYISAYHYIASDYNFGKHIENSVENGFTPTISTTFVGRQMTDEQKMEVHKKHKETLTGTDGENFMLNFVRSKDDMPHHQVFEPHNLDKTIAIMSQLNDSKILTAHNVTSPTLFGIAVSGKLGGTGEELITSYYIFRATETLPNRQEILRPLNILLERSYGSELGVAEEPIESIKENIVPVIGEGKPTQNTEEDGD